MLKILFSDNSIFLIFFIFLKVKNMINLLILKYYSNYKFLIIELIKIYSYIFNININVLQFYKYSIVILNSFHKLHINGYLYTSFLYLKQHP